MGEVRSKSKEVKSEYERKIVPLPPSIVIKGPPCQSDLLLLMPIVVLCFISEKNEFR